MQKHSVALAASILIGLSGCGGSGDTPVTGQWALNLYPTGQSSTQSEPVTVDSLYLNEENGEVKGRSDAFTISGHRTGNVLDLTVFAPDSSGAAVEHSYLKLNLLGDNSVQGTGYTPEPVDVTPGDSVGSESSASPARVDFGVSGRMVSTLSSADANTVIGQPNLGGAASNIAHTVCSIFSSAASFGVGILTGNAYRPMGGCVLAKSGGGYYVFGREAAGSLLPVWTQNVYVPVEWAACTARDYKFKFSYKGPALLTSGIELIAKSKSGGNYLPGLDLLKVGGKSLTDLAVELDDLRQKYGNYALLVARHPRTGFIGLYVIKEKGNSDELKNEAIIKTLAGNLHASVMVGKDIKDTFSLRRGPLPNVCLDQVQFTYLLGSADVTLD